MNNRMNYPAAGRFGNYSNFAKNLEDGIKLVHTEKIE